MHRKHTQKLIEKERDPDNEPYLFDIGGKFSKPTHDMCPCLLRSAQEIWITNKHRRLNLEERCRLHGISPNHFKVAVSDQQLKNQLGNAVSVNVLERLLVRLLPAAGLTGRLRDRWASFFTGSAAELKRTRDCKLSQVCLVCGASGHVATITKGRRDTCPLSRPGRGKKQPGDGADAPPRKRRRCEPHV